ncbi:NADPH-dependent assimilatory sulfite reductase hemoprotein subunit [Candidatus Poribacteria bacterium]|nr:NADPH-dependent assimilatory sulfite reductase hemoprotein subunit [Candidatus Poribacteria bacterium]
MSLADSDRPGFKPSANEVLKEASRGLRGTIAEELTPSLEAFTEDSGNLLKHHGTYQQDNRDARSARRKAGLGRQYSMMVRTKTPGGRLTAEQYLLCDDLATKYGQNDLRITSRQGFQFHGVLKRNLRTLIHDLNHLQRITTQGACGDVVRNVMCCAVADIDPAFAGIEEDLLAAAQRISDHFLAKSSSYFDLWLDDEQVEVTPEGDVFFKSKEPSRPVNEPLYGKTYLPRKFKIALCTDFDNSVDVYANDAGAIAHIVDGRVAGFEVLAGGGLGHSHGKPETYARLASHITYVAPDELLAVIEAIVKAQRDHGNRENRQQARLKYTIDRLGLDKFRETVAGYYGKPLPPPKGIRPAGQPDYLGWAKQRQPGLNRAGLWIENGRIRDFEGSFQFKTGLRAIVERFRPSVRLTPHHNLILADIRDEDAAEIKQLLAGYRIPTDAGIPKLRRHEMACPALPLCGLALAEAERGLPAIMQAIEAAGLAGEDVVIRMTGCPNSCARPETAEIGIIGRGPDKYHVYTGADRLGSRMNQLTVENLNSEAVCAALVRLLTAWKQGRSQDESFGDWSHKMGTELLRALASPPAGASSGPG